MHFLSVSVPGIQSSSCIVATRFARRCGGNLQHFHRAIFSKQSSVRGIKSLRHPIDVFFVDKKIHLSRLIFGASGGGASGGGPGSDSNISAHRWRRIIINPTIPKILAMSTTPSSSSIDGNVNRNNYPMSLSTLQQNNNLLNRRMDDTDQSRSGLGLGSRSGRARLAGNGSVREVHNAAAADRSLQEMATIEDDVKEGKEEEEEEEKIDERGIAALMGVCMPARTEMTTCSDDPRPHHLGTETNIKSEENRKADLKAAVPHQHIEHHNATDRTDMEIGKEMEVRWKPMAVSQLPCTFGFEVEGFRVEAVSVGGQETCIIIHNLKVAFDIGRCPQPAVFQETLLISHTHMDHIGGLPFYAATRGLLSLRPPNVVIPSVNVGAVERLFEVYRELDGAKLENNLIGLDVGSEWRMPNNYIVKPFKTYHVIPSQGYIIYSRKQKLKREYLGLPGLEIKRMKDSGIEVTDTVEVPEVAFTGDTMSDFITDPANSDVLRAKVLFMETTFIDDRIEVEHARRFGHTHLHELGPLSEHFKNKAVVLIHFSPRYKKKEILDAVQGLPENLRGRIIPLTARFD